MISSTVDPKTSRARAPSHTAAPGGARLPPDPPRRGREEALYRACAELVEPWSATEVLTRVRAAGLDWEPLLAELRAAQAALTGTRPSRLRPGRFEVRLLADGRARVQSYRAYDPRVVPAGVLEDLATFDGRPTDEVLAAEGRPVSGEQLEALIDLRMLVPDGESDVGQGATASCCSPSP